MVTAANIFLWDNYVGAVLWNSDTRTASFEFEPGFLTKDWNIAPLTMPVEEVSRGQIFSFPNLTEETFRGLPGLLADSLPDKFGQQLINAWLALQGRESNSMNPVEMLCYIGKHGMGALEYHPAVRLDKGSSNFLEVSELVDLAQKAILRKAELNAQMDKEEKQAMLDIIKVGTSAGGARAKAIIAINKQNKVKSGQVEVPEGYTHWLIKLDGVVDEQLDDPKGYGRIEYAYSKMAVDCGIEMTECRLLEEKDRAHFMTRRFDRPDHRSKLHMQTLCGLCHYDYNNPLAYSYEQAFQAMRRLRLTYQAANQLYRRMVFNVISVNHDDHTKNLSFLMDKSGQWRLAPAYDLTYAFKPSHKFLAQHQLSINNKRNGINKSDLLSVAKQMNIKKAQEIIEEVRAIFIKWPEYASMARIPEKQMASIGKAHLIEI